RTRLPDGVATPSSGRCEITYAVNEPSDSFTMAVSNGRPPSGRPPTAPSASSAARAYVWTGDVAVRGGTIRPNVPTSPASGLKLVSATIASPFDTAPFGPGSFDISLR